MAGWIEGNLVGHLRVHCGDHGFAAQNASIVGDADTIALGQPPWHQFIQDTTYRVDSDDRAGIATIVELGNMHLKLGIAEDDGVSRTVGWFSKCARQALGFGHGYGWSGVADSDGIGGRRRQGRTQGAGCVQPENLAQTGLIYEKRTCSRFERPCSNVGRCKIARQLLQPILIADQVKAKLLFQPEHVANQGNTLLLQVRTPGYP
ncbi:MAG: hypothetical protein WCV99_03310 [Sterolibacterium sp.]